MATKKTSTQETERPKATPSSKSVAHKSSSGKDALKKLPEQGPPSLPDEALEDVIALEDRWFSPKVLASILGIDEKWLSSVREGVKGVEGPPYKKLGEGRSAPIRYNYGKFLKWLDKFPDLINTSGKVAARFASAAEFFAAEDLGQRWLFADADGEPQDIIVAINSGAFESDNDPEVYWLTFWEWLAKSAQSGRMVDAIEKSLRSVREQAIAIYEEDAMRFSVPPGKPAHKASIDNPKAQPVGKKKRGGR